MTNSEYFDTPGLSNSGMKDLMVSPLRYWHLHLNPNRPEDEPTAEMIFGSALHCAVLESPSVFDSRYVCEVNPEDYPGLLRTVPEIKAWCAEKGSPCKAKDLKDDAVNHALSLDPSVPILQEIERKHFEANQGKTILPLDNWTLLAGAAKALRDEPRVNEILSKGKPEVTYFGKEPITGVPLKAKMDWVHPNLLLDVKTFTQQRGKSIDKSVADAVFYEAYYRQAVLYSSLRTICEGNSWTTIAGAEFVFAFVESLPPHEVRIKVMRPKFAGNATLLWTRGLVEISKCARQYAEYMAHFGVDKPWKYAQEIDVLADEEIPALSYAA